MSRLLQHPRVHGYVRKLLMPLGVDFYLPRDDRMLMEREILPWFSHRPGFARVLFIGCDWYTRGYRRWFDSASYWTLDTDPSKARYGARRHIVASASEVSQHFAPASLDLVVCNGVYGWGLDRLAEFEAAVGACRASLRPGGVFVLGWDNTPQRTPFALSDSHELARLDPFNFPPLRASHFIVGNGPHAFDFFAVPAGCA